MVDSDRLSSIQIFETEVYAGTENISLLFEYTPFQKHVSFSFICLTHWKHKRVEWFLTCNAQSTAEGQPLERNESAEMQSIVLYKNDNQLHTIQFMGIK